MCLAVPGKVATTFREHDLLMGKVDFDGVQRRVCLEHVADVQIGDYVLIHAGFAIQRIDETEARRVFDLLAEFDELGDVRDASAEPPA